MQNRLLASSLMILGAVLAATAARHADIVRAEDAKPAAKIESWKPEDFIYSETAGPYRVSPDGKWLVWVKSVGDKDKDARTGNLFLSSLTEKKEIQLTRGNDNNREPRWSPDGEWIAFVSNRARPKAKPEHAPVQIWLINPRGGEAWPLTESVSAPDKIEWLDKDTLIYSAEEDPALYAQELKQKKDDSVVVDDADHEPPVRLYKFGVKEKKATRLTGNTDWIRDWAVSRDGKFAVAGHARSLHYAFDQKVPPIVVLHDLSNGTEKQIFTERRIRPEFFEWAADNSGFYLGSAYSTDPKFVTANIAILYYFDLASGKPARVNLDWENGLSRGFQAVPGGFVTLLAAGARTEMARYSAAKSGESWTWKREAVTGDHAHNIEEFRSSEDGKTIAYTHSTASKLPQIFRGRLDGAQIGETQQVTKLNETLVNGRAYAKSEVIRWKGSNDDEVEGILYYPTNYEAGKKYPVITAIHGGPAGADFDLWDESWAYPIQLLAQRGALVLRPNYHGSSHYGLKWVESICCGKYYDLETPDINAGVDYLITKGLGDPERIATMGWSNGSILSTSLLVNYPSRYKVASVGAGDVEWISDWGNVKFGDSFDSYYFGKSPLEDPELYVRKSPFFKMDKIQAPVLIFHGTADDNVPPAQSWSYFRALQYHGKVPVKFVIFPGEPHGPRKLTHQMRKVEEEVAWFDKYFFKTAKDENEALKKGSPLEAALRAKNLDRSHGYYGTELKDQSVMIPELVKRGDLDIARFEVTRLQFLEFESRRDMKKRKPIFWGIQLLEEEATLSRLNSPANNISAETAKAYVSWLSKQTKQVWRIPYEDEVKDLYESREGENTLDYWAGYAPNPEDAARLRERAKGLSGTAPLLKEVGCFHGQGKDDEEPIYDLGGNVAEWVLTRDGKGKVIGGSADCPADAKSNCTPAAEYVGFRVVRGEARPAAK